MSADEKRLRAVPEDDDYESWSMPIDYAILRQLPKQGSRLGYHVLGSTVKHITEIANEGVAAEGRLSTGVVAQRITRWLLAKGMVVPVRVHGSGGSRGYQITERGERMLAADPDRKETT